MKIPKVADIVGIINKIAPMVLAETWDNPGLQVGDPSAEVHRVMVALDPTAAAVDSAIATSCQLLVTHHPLIFKPLKSISAATPHGALIQKAIKGGVSIISLHTNYDIASGGLNDLLADKIGLSGAHAEKLNHVGHLPVAALPQHALNAVSKRNVDALHLAARPAYDVVMV